MLGRPALVVTDLISSSGFAGTCPAPNTYRGSHAARSRFHPPGAAQRRPAFFGRAL